MIERMVERIEVLAAELRGELAARRFEPRWLLVSRFGFEFLDREGHAGRERTIELGLLDGECRLLARTARLGDVPVLLVESEGETRAAALLDAMPVLVTAGLGIRGLVLLMAAGALPGCGRAPALAAIRDWIRVGNEDPLRGLGAKRQGARFPEMRGLSRRSANRELAVASELLEARDELPPQIAVARRGLSGATDAELVAWRRLGGEIVVEGCAAEVVAARHQGLACVALALVLDRADVECATDPGTLAASAELLLPRLAELLPELLRRVDAAPAEDAAGDEARESSS